MCWPRNCEGKMRYVPGRWGGVYFRGMKHASDDISLMDAGCLVTQEMVKRRSLCNFKFHTNCRVVRIREYLRSYRKLQLTKLQVTFTELTAGSFRIAEYTPSFVCRRYSG
jgi:hypothetical protein